MDKRNVKIYPVLGQLNESNEPKVGTFEHASPWKNANTAFYWTNFEYPLYHAHTDWEMQIVLNDEMIHFINGTEQKICAGSACLIGPKDKHAVFYPNRIKNQYQGVSLIARDSYMRALLNLYSPNLYEELRNTPETLYFTLSHNTLEKITGQLLDIQTYESENALYCEQQCNIIFSGLILKFLEQRQTSTAIPDVLKPLIQQLNNPLITSEQIKAAQRELPYSYPQLTRVFKKYLHCTVTQYVNRAKLQYAKELLSGTDMKLIDITNELNFESASHFHNLFKKQFGMTPAEYRKLNSANV